jgi:glutamate-1-semialdehyde 2,1-aminomutase
MCSNVLPEVEEYIKNTPSSKRIYEVVGKYIPGGVNTAIQFFEPHPLYMVRGSGSRLWDGDGREYVDHCLAYGAMTAGHANPVIADAIRAQLEKGTLLGFQGSGVEELAREIIRRYPFIDMLRFANTGLEATFFACRLARAATGRKYIIKMEGAYHGASDILLITDKPRNEVMLRSVNPASIPDSLGTPDEVVKQTLVVHFNDIEGLEKVLRSHENEVAAIITEPVQSNSGIIPPEKGYFESVRRLCDDHGALLIIDEVKTGCNLSEGGGTQIYGIRPDLVTLAKTIGGGTPMAAFGGKRKYMEMITPLGGAVHYGTYNGNSLSVAAGTACLKGVFTQRTYEKIMRLGDELYKGVVDALKDTRTKAAVGRCTMMGSIFFGLDSPPKNYREAAKCDAAKWYRYWINMLNRKVVPSGSAWFEEWMISAMHDADDIKRTIQATYDTLKYLKS